MQIIYRHWIIVPESVTTAGLCMRPVPCDSSQLPQTKLTIFQAATLKLASIIHCAEISDSYQNKHRLTKLQLRLNIQMLNKNAEGKM